MANIKFSAFTQKVASADVDFLVGYTGGDNVRITPSVFDDRYLPLAGGTMTGNTNHGDSVYSYWGASNDLQIYHDGTNSVINNETGNLQIYNNADDKDIIFLSDDGSGGTAEYFIVDGSAEQTRFYKDTRHANSIKANFGNSDDLQIYHDSTDSIVRNITGSVYFDNNADNQDIVFRCDDGGGGLTEYFRLDGGTTKVIASKNFAFLDSVQIELGDSGDFNMSHNGTDVTLQNFTGDFNIVNKANDKDIIFQSDNGSGGTSTYFYIDGSAVLTRVAKSFLFEDNVKSIFGGGSDLQIYHDGSNSFIDDSGTGDLRIRSNFLKIEKYTGETMATFNDDNSVALYFNNSIKFETTNTGVKIIGVNQYADNAAALAGGLTVGDVYRTGDLLKIVN